MDAFARLINHKDCREKSWFGGRSFVINNQVVLAHFDSESPWNGTLIPTSVEHHESLRSEIPVLRAHPVLKKWLFVATQHREYKRVLKHVVDLVLSGDSRIGIEHGAKHRRRLEKGDSIPVHQARNIGPKTTEVLASVDVLTLKQLKTLGWERVLEKLQRRSPEHCNLNMARALIGAIENTDWREVPKSELTLARSLLQTLRTGD